MCATSFSFSGLRYEYLGFVTAIYGIQTNPWHSAILSVPMPGATPATGSIAGYGSLLISRAVCRKAIDVNRAV